MHNYHDRSGSKYIQVHDLEKVFINKYYRTSDQDNDIAIVRVTKDIIWSVGVGPACLPFKYRDETFYEKLVQIAGWGTISYGGPLSEVLNKVTLKVIDTDDCANRIIWVNKKKLCTYEPKKDACQSDSGGPVYFTDGRYYVIGIVSFGMECGKFSSD